MADVATEAKYPGEYLTEELSIDMSRDKVTIALGETLEASTVLGEKTNGAATATADAGNTGNGVMGAITVGNGAKQGDYTLTFIESSVNAGDFMIEDPNGVNVGGGDVAATFSGGGLSFTLADGANDFVAGDRFAITVAEGSGEYVQLDPAATDGSEVAAGILFSPIDASTAAKTGVITSALSIVMDDALTWPDDITVDQKATAIKQLKQQHIKIK